MTKKLLITLTLLSASLSAQAAPISLVPQLSNLNVAIVDFDVNARFAVFDFDENQACNTGNPLLDCRQGNPLLIGRPLAPAGLDIIDIEPAAGTDFNAKSIIGQSTIPLLNSPGFILTTSFDNGASWWNPFNVETLGTGQGALANLNILRVDFFGVDTINLEFRITTALVLGAQLPSPVPVPAAAWLFASGILGLIAVARRKRQHVTIDS